MQVEAKEQIVPAPMETQGHQKESSKAWTQEENNYLRTLVAIHGTRDWSAISSNLRLAFRESRWSRDEIKEHWYNVLDPSITKRAWSDEEEIKLLRAHYIYQNKWADVAATLDGRSSNTSKNRFYCVFRKVKNKIKRKDQTYTTSLELLEIRYIIYVMLRYYDFPPPVLHTKAKPAKDFVQTLLHNLKKEEVLQYKADMQRLCGPDWKPDDFEAEFAALLPPSQGPNVPSVQPEPPLLELSVPMAMSPAVPTIPTIATSPMKIDQKPIRTRQGEAEACVRVPPPKGDPATRPKDAPEVAPALALAPARAPVSAVRICPIDRRHPFTLPVPNIAVKGGALTREEKDFVMQQLLQSKQAASAGTFYQPMMLLSPQGYPQGPISSEALGTMPLRPQRQGFEGFSDFSDVAVGQNLQPPHLASPMGSVNLAYPTSSPPQLYPMAPYTTPPPRVYFVPRFY